MLRTLLTPAFLSVLPALAAGQAVPKPGERLPPVELTGLANTQARAFSDFYGRAVLLDFFAYWCQPCAMSVPHLNELRQQYEARGLTVVGVTAEGAKKTAPFVERNKVAYPYGFDSSGALHRLFQVQSIPFTVLVDPTGVIVWTGHPSKLTPEKIERALEGASTKPVWQWPEPARALAVPLAKGEYAAALELARTLEASDGFDPAAFVQERVKAQLEQFERLIGRGDYLDGLELSERLAQDLTGLPEAEALARRVEAVRADPAAQAYLAAHARLLDLEKRAGAVRNLEDGEKLRPEIEALVKEVAGKRLERRAQALLDSVDRAIEKAKKHG